MIVTDRWTEPLSAVAQSNTVGYTPRKYYNKRMYYNSTSTFSGMLAVLFVRGS